MILGDCIIVRYGDLLGNPAWWLTVIDGGYGDDGKRAAEHIRQWYGKNTFVNLLISTHPDGDHCNGTCGLLDNIDVKSIWMHKPWEHGDTVKQLFQAGPKITSTKINDKLKRALEAAHDLAELAAKKKIPITEPFTGLRDPTGRFTVCGPTKTYYQLLVSQFDCLGNGSIADVLAYYLKSGVAAAKDVVASVTEDWYNDGIHDNPKPISPQNNSSVITLFQSDGRNVLFTADAVIPALTGAADWLQAQGFDFNALTLIQVPHHGSRRNVGPTILDRLLGLRLLQPYQDKDVKRHAFVSAPKDGGPKHPSKRVMNAFRRRGVPVTRDEKGSVIRFDFQAPDRGWQAVPSQPFFSSVEAIDE